MKGKVEWIGRRFADGVNFGDWLCDYGEGLVSDVIGMRVESSLNEPDREGIIKGTVRKSLLVNPFWDVDWKYRFGGIAETLLLDGSFDRVVVIVDTVDGSVCEFRDCMVALTNRLGIELHFLEAVLVDGEVELLDFDLVDVDGTWEGLYVFTDVKYAGGGVYDKYLVADYNC